MPLDINAKTSAEFDHHLAIFGDHQMELFREMFEESHNLANFCPFQILALKWHFGVILHPAMKKLTSQVDTRKSFC